jgi:hypothetical protein
LAASVALLYRGDAAVVEHSARLLAPCPMAPGLLPPCPTAVGSWSHLAA